MSLPPHIDPDEVHARLALWRAPKVGPKHFMKLLSFHGSIAMAFQKSKEMPEALVEFLKQANWYQAEQDLRWLEINNHHLLCIDDPIYPKALAEITAAPPLLFIKGSLSPLTRPQIAVVGSRNPSYYGEQVVQHLVREIATKGFVITSGLALGIDGLSHQAAVQAGTPTIGVLAVGLDQIYPKRHTPLAETILNAEGTLVSEFGIGTRALPENFPRRNRIISGLSLGTVVIEASIKSGSLITARYAMEQGRDVFAVPGSIFQSLSHGCHALLKEGAYCIESAIDVYQHYEHIIPTATWPHQEAKAISKAFSSSLSDSEAAVFATLTEIPQTVDELHTQLILSMSVLQSALMQCCLKGLAKQTWLGYVRMI